MSKKSGERLRFDAATERLVVRMLREWVRPYTGKLVMSFLLMALVAATTGAYPLLIDQAYAMFSAQDRTMLLVIPVVIVLVTAVKAVSMYAQTVLTTDIVQRIVTDVRLSMFAHLLTADTAQLHAAPTGTLTSRFISDVDLIRNALTRTLTNLVRDILTVITLVGAMFYLDWVMSLIVFVIYPIAAVPIVNIGKRLRRVSRDTQAQMGDMTALLTESLAGARMVKTYSLEDYERARASRAFEDNYDLTMKATRARSRIDPMMEILGGAAVAGVIAFAGYRMAMGEGSVGAFSGFVGALLMAAQPVRAIGTLNAVLQEGLAATQRIFELVDERPTITERPDAKPLALNRAAVSLRSVRFAYEEGAETLKGIDLDVPAGATVALVGRSGAGKSTVFNLIPRLYDATEGEVLIDGQDVRSVTLKSLRGVISLVSQDTVLFNDTVRANIAFGRLDAPFDDIVAAAKAAAAHDFIARLPQGYDTVIGDRGVKLSGGERQRLALARAFLKDAPILLLDEATSALDSESERLVQGALERLTKGRTTLVIAHRLATVRNADRIVVMEGGRIVEQGTHDALIEQNGTYARLSKLQFGEDGEAALLAP
ncbi:ABC transporter ATP-binding protein [Azospirillum canadense]|uniref:ABC transporter ATP-binding protein n=1 Tax=Azospirillum canadense TaxID=403962 RepID=UPI002227062F|nr:ABC transporter ATP-binding protein [Azospirillum canadense]MCW2243299.1 subfamily B ATP-binding cassette protein MsbA [Azospirillum canadense]